MINIYSPECYTPRFSVIIPVFQNTEMLIYSIGSLAQQFETSWEAIYGFDGDNPDMVAEFEDEPPHENRFRLLTNSKHSTIGELLNNCLDAARGDYIIILHAEDALHPDALHILAREVDTKAQAKLDHCYFLHRHNTAALGQPHNQLPHLTSEFDEDFYPYETLYYLYRRSTITQNNIRFSATNSAHLHEEFSATYAQHIPVFTSIATELNSDFDPFTRPPNMVE